MLSRSVLAWACSLVLAASTVAADKPNIVYILCDDLGYGDVKCMLLEKYVADGRSTPGAPQKNAVKVEINKPQVKKK